MRSSTCSPLKVSLNTLQINFKNNFLKMPHKRASTEMGRACKTSLFVCLFVCLSVYFLSTAYITFTRQSLSVEGNGHSSGKETFILQRQLLPRFWSGNIF
jgi:hypothetical protein